MHLFLIRLLNPTSFPSPSNQGFTLLLEAQCFVLFDFRVFAYVISHSASLPYYTEHSVPGLYMPCTKRFSFSILSNTLCGMYTVFYFSCHLKMRLCRGSGLLGELLQWTGSADISVTCRCHFLWLYTQKWMMDLLGASFSTLDKCHTLPSVTGAPDNPSDGARSSSHFCVGCCFKSFLLFPKYLWLFLMSPLCCCWHEGDMWSVLGFLCVVLATLELSL